jgi:hypothetical protein
VSIAAALVFSTETVGPVVLVPLVFDQFGALSAMCWHTVGPKTYCPPG